MTVRPYQPCDLESMAALFIATVRNVNSSDYSPEQIAAWAQDPPDFDHWRSHIAPLTIWVAEAEGRIVGFCGLGEDGLIDLLYTDHRFLRRGVGRRLLEVAEVEARRRNVRRLTTEASITARPFFERTGYRIIQEQMAECRGATFLNYVMAKDTPPES